MEEEKKTGMRATRRPKQMDEEYRQPTKKKKAGKIILIILAVLLGLLLIASAVLYGVFHHYYSMIDYDDGSGTWVTEEEILPPESDETHPAVESELIADESEVSEYLESMTTPETSAPVEPREPIVLKSGLGEATRSYYANYISKQDDVINILLIGVDSQGTSLSGRSDVMLLISICPSQKKIVMTSFLRDILVQIPGYAENRLNAAYAFGGPALLTRVIETTFGIRIDRYAMVNFSSFVSAIKVVEPVRLKLTDAEYEVVKTPNYISDPVPTDVPGYYDLKSDAVLLYARIRSLDNDFGRTNRQRTVVTAIFNELKGMSPTAWNSILEAILPNIRTNMTQSDILFLLSHATDYVGYTLVSNSIPQSGEYKYMMVSGRSVLGVDFAASRRHLAEWIYP